MSARQKGNRNRNKLIKLLEGRGYQVAIVERTGRFIKEKDMFGLFDLIGINPETGIIFVQVATNTPHSHHKYIEFQTKYRAINVLQFVWKDNKGFDVYNYQMNRHHLVDWGVK